MARKLKLKKRPGSSSSGVNKSSKSIPVEDVDGNKHILKATVISVDDGKVQKDTTQELDDDKFERMGLSERIIQPPLSPEHLSLLQETSSELGQILDIMSIGIDGFGGRIQQRDIPKEISEKFKQDIRQEKVWLDTFLQFPNPEGSFTKMKKETREDLESTGNAYWELIQGLSRNGKYSHINKLDAGSMRVCRKDNKFTRFNIKYVDQNFQIQTKSFMKKFRCLVQVMGNKKVFFKEFGDPRVVDKRTGQVKDATLPKKFHANEVYHFKLYTPRRTPYGLPRYTGNIIAIRGSRSADETNIITQQNNNVPSMAVMVSGGQLTEYSVNRIQEFVDQQIKSQSNYSKFLILEGESSHDSLSGPNAMKIEIKELTNAQHNDQLWQDYDDNNAAKLRRSFRIPPILIGKSDDYDKATAQVSERLAEKYVFNPEREDFDEIINKILVHQGFRFHLYKSNSPNVTDDQDLVRILTGAERTGGLTPRISRFLLEDILNRKLPEFPEVEGFNPDLPFSYSLALLMHNAGEASQNGTNEPQGQTPKAPGKPGRPSKEGEEDEGDESEKMINDLYDRISSPDSLLGLTGKLAKNPDKYIPAFESLAELLEDTLDEDSFGEPDREYFSGEKRTKKKKTKIANGSNS